MPCRVAIFSGKFGIVDIRDGYVHEGNRGVVEGARDDSVVLIKWSWNNSAEYYADGKKVRSANIWAAHFSESLVKRGGRLVIG